MRTGRELIVAGIDPDTGLRMSPQEWHTRLILMTASIDEYAAYLEMQLQLA